MKNIENEVLVNKQSIIQDYIYSKQITLAKLEINARSPSNTSRQAKTISKRIKQHQDLIRTALKQLNEIKRQMALKEKKQ
jgi:hypothetical protein